MQSNTMNVEVAYALKESQSILSLNVPIGTTALQAVHLSGITNTHPEIDVNHLKLGIFSKPIASNTILKALDRVEIYRPLIADAKEARKARVAASRAALKAEQIAKNNQKG